MNDDTAGRTPAVWVAAAALMLAVLSPVCPAAAGPGQTGRSEPTAARSPTPPGVEQPAPAAALRGDIESAKRKALALDRELSRLEHELLFPATTRFAVFIGLEDALGDSGPGHGLRSVQLKLDNRVVANHVYSAEELAALRAGGIQQAYIGNVAPGKHRLVASVTATGPDGDRHVDTPIEFEKAAGLQYVQLRLSTAADKPYLHVRALVRN